MLVGAGGWGEVGAGWAGVVGGRLPEPPPSSCPGLHFAPTAPRPHRVPLPYRAGVPQAMGNDARAAEFMKGRRVMEVNPGHPIILGLKAKVDLESRWVQLGAAGGLLGGCGGAAGGKCLQGV